MPKLKKKSELADEARILAQSFKYVRHHHITYKPVDFETGDDMTTPPPERTIWIPMSKEDIRAKAQTQFDTLFETEQVLSSFDFMVAQCSIQHTTPATTLLVRTKDGLRELREDGQLHEPTGKFVPNTLKPLLNESDEDKETVLTLISAWVGGEQEALAMLRHFATALVPHWSAVKYVLLMGDGRNGKSLLLTMLQNIFGSENCSSVTRQDISDKSPAVTSLNGKLLNLVFDGQAMFLKDSGLEKSLIAGEMVGIRRLYSSELTPVQTNALFIEGLNREPKSSDKSSALQARLIRFWFPNKYPQDRDFWNLMTSERYVGALLALLIDNYVRPQEAAVMLAPTQLSVELQLEHMYENSYALQFIKHLEERSASGADELLDMDTGELTTRFASWRLSENDITAWPEPAVLNVFRGVLVTERRSKRVNGKPRKVRVITAMSRETELFIEYTRGELSNDDTVVDE